MPRTIDNFQHDEVIRRRLQNQTFDKIAAEMGISHGTACNIEKEWKDALGETDASAVVTFVKVTAKQGITPAQCAEGARLFGILNELGVTPETLGQFLSNLSSKVIAKGVTPNVVATTLTQMSVLLEEFGVPLVKVPEALRDARNKLDGLNARIAENSSKLKLLEQDLQSSLNEVHATHDNMALFLSVQDKLKAMGLSLAKIDDVANLINNLEKLGSDPVQMAEALAKGNSLQEQREALEKAIGVKEEKVRSMKEEIAVISTRLSTLSKTQAFLNEFVALGFSEDMLLELLIVIKGVAERRSIPFNLASAAFMSEVKAGYEPVLGFKAVLQILQNSIKDTQIQLNQEQTKYAIFIGSIKAINSLQSNGIGEKELIYWQKVFRDYPQLTAEMLTAHLRDYADLLQAILALQKIHEKLESEIEMLSRNIKASYKEKARISAELEQIKRVAAEEERQLREKIEQLSKRVQQILPEVSTDAVRQTAQKALLEGISLQAARSPLLPIVLWENGGSPPKSKDVFVATEFVLGIWKWILDPSDMLAKDLENFLAALQKRIYGGSESAVNSSGKGGSVTRIERGIAADETKK